MSEINFETARRNMVEQQIRTWDVLDPRVLDLIARMRREDFVPARYRNLAYADTDIPIGRGHVMMAPKLEARLLQELDIDPKDRILEVGTGSGYMTALLASLGKQVYSVEIVPELKLEAARRLETQGISNVTLDVGDAARGWPRHKPYDVILLTGSLPLLPEGFTNTLAVGGRMIAVIGKAPVMEAKLIRRVREDCFEERSLFETVVPPLMNAQEPSKFTF